MPFEISRRNLLRDAATTAGLLAVSLLGLLVTYDVLAAEGEAGTVPRPVVSVLLLVAVVAPLAVRRRFPATVTLIVTAAFIVLRVLEVPEGWMSSLALFLAIYTAGAWDPEPRRRLAVRTASIAASMGTLAWSLVRDATYVDVDGLLMTVFSVVINAIFFVAAWRMGDLARTQRENEVELASRADQLAAEREARAAQAVLDERVRIARELHDVVAHHVSVMGVQAGAARRVLASDPERAIGALESIEDSGRQAVGELQRLVGFLRSEDDTGDGAPQPRIEHLPALLAQSRTAGLPIDHRVVGAVRPLPGSVELTAYRIVQESVTNVLRHAGTVPTTVVLTYLRDALEVEVVNGGGSRPGTVAGGGRGLVGMRERVAMVGGSLSAGPAPAGGYRVQAILPTATPYDSAETESRTGAAAPAATGTAR